MYNLWYHRGELGDYNLMYFSIIQSNVHELKLDHHSRIPLSYATKCCSTPISSDALSSLRGGADGAEIQVRTKALAELTAPRAMPKDIKDAARMICCGCGCSLVV